MPRDEPLDAGWDDIGKELALEDARAFVRDLGSAAVQAQGSVLPDDAAAWDVTCEAVIGAQEVLT